MEIVDLKDSGVMNLQELGLTSDSSSDEEERERATPSSPKNRADRGDDKGGSKGSGDVDLKNVPEPGIKTVEVSGGNG